jgi:hypothetical protein
MIGQIVNRKKKNLMTLLIFPIYNYQPMEHQTGGHSIMNGHKRCILEEKKKKKKILYKELSKKEIIFYEKILPNSDFQEFTPIYYGKVRIEDKYGASGKIINKLEYLMLENFSENFQAPCIIDIKIGKRTYSKNSNNEKILREITKHPLQSELGYRICGMQYFDNEENKYVKLYKKECRKKTIDDINDLLLFCIKRKGDEELPLIIKELKKIEKFMEKQNVIGLVSSSILIIYEGIKNKTKVVVKLIDFANIDDLNEKVDENFLFGLKKLISFLDGFTTS